MRNTAAATGFTVTAGAFTAADIDYDTFASAVIIPTTNAGTRFASHFVRLRHYQSSVALKFINSEY